MNPRGKKPSNRVRSNNEIRAKEVRVIDSESKMIGIMHIKDAIRRAEAAELDLVEISPNAKPPVVKIIDYGKHMYELQKKEKLQKKNQLQQQMKEIRFKWRTDTHDFNFKTRHAKDFLESGNKVKASVMFRGREITHQEVGRELLEKFIDELKDVSKIDSKLKMEGRNMIVILAPLKTGKKKN
jgi:translation initiation factor IF-3